VLLHYLVLAAIVAFFLWLVVPRAIAQVDQAIKNVPATRGDRPGGAPIDRDQARHRAQRRPPADQDVPTVLFPAREADR